MGRSWIHLLVCCLILPACIEPGERSADRPGDVVLGLIAPFVHNRPTVDGAVLAVEEINAAGGITVGGESKRIELIAEDNEGQPETSVSKALKLINRESAVALLGVPRSFNAIPVGRIAEQHGIPLVSTMSTNPETTAGKRYVFRMAFLDSFQGKALADFAYEDLGARRAAILFDAVGPYNTYLAEVFRRVFHDRGGQVVAFEVFTEDQLDITQQLRKINESGAELLFLPNSSKFVKLHVSAARQSGFVGTLLGGDSWSHGIDPVDHPEFQGSYFSDLWAPGRADEHTGAFITEYHRAFGKAPTASAALAYDAISMIAKAIANGGVAPDSIRQELVSMGAFDGVAGPISFRSSGDPTRSVFIRRFEEDGRIRLHREIKP